MSSFSERNDRKSRARQGPGGGPKRPGKASRAAPTAPAEARAGAPPPRRQPARSTDAEGWIWGRHAVLAALANPARRDQMRLVASPERAREVEAAGLKRPHVRLDIAEAADIARLLPAGAVHQGLALKAPPLAEAALEDVTEPARGLMLMLDQITDPQNVGALFRSAAAFGARALIVQDRHAPPLTGAVAKAAAGAIEQLPCVRVTNLSRALERLADLGWRAVGLDGTAAETLEAVLDDRPTVLVMGSEGDGLRRLVTEHCDALASIPMPGGFESLNVSNAAAIALYEASRQARTEAR